MKTLRQQMTQAMVLRGFVARTQEAYLAAVTALARHFQRPPDALSGEQLQAYLLFLITEKKLAYASVNQAACAFRFLFERVLRREHARLDVPMAKLPKRLPQILSREAVARLIGATTSLRGRTLLMATYGAGLRVSELCALQVTDIESAPDRMCIKVRQGKGGKDRYTLLSPRLLDQLRVYWRVRHPRLWLFPNPHGSAPIDVSVAQRGFLFPVHALSRVFRGKFVAALTQARATTLRDVAALTDTLWRTLLARLHAHPWVVYAKQPLGGPEQVLAYLGRYTHRVAISNERIVAIDRDEVVFRVRADPATGSKRRVRLDGVRFIARFLLHVLPSGFKRIRHYGLLAARHKAQRLAAARQALAAPPPDPVVIESVAQFMQRVAHIDASACTHCHKGHFIVIGPLPPLPASARSARGPPCV